MMKTNRSLLIFSALWASLGIISATPAQPAVPPQPTEIIRHFCDYLKSLHQFSYHADVTYDAVDDGGHKVQHTFAMETAVRRPDRLRVDAAGDVVNKAFFFNGSTIILYDKSAKVYGVLDVPPDIEAALEKAHKDFNLRVALTDLASPKLYDRLSQDLSGTQNLGIENVRGIPCYHLVLDRKDMQVHLWIDTGSKPLLRKLVITEKDSPQAAQWTALLGEWNLSPKLDDGLFRFVVPAGVHKIAFIPAQKAAASGPDTQPAKAGK
jgi:hypothetical protein